jgi:hypothetical protein
VGSASRVAQGRGLGCGTQPIRVGNAFGLAVGLIPLRLTSLRSRETDALTRATAGQASSPPESHSGEAGRGSPLHSSNAIENLRVRGRDRRQESNHRSRPPASPHARRSQPP